MANPPPELFQRVQPKRRLVLSMSPYLPIKANEDGTGGGIRLRVYGERPEPYLLDVVWGETTEIEVGVPRG